MSRVALSELIFQGANPVRTAPGKTVYVYRRGTEEQATLYAAESGETTLSQPLTTNSAGLPTKSGAQVWVEPGSYDLRVSGLTSPWEASRAADGPYLDAREFVGYTRSTSDKSTQLAKALQRAYEHEMGIEHPPWTVVISEPMRPESNVEWKGTYGRSGLKVGAASNCAAIKSPRYGEGGTTGGAERTTLSGLEVDGNFSENAGTTEPLVALDGIGPQVEQCLLKNGYVLLSSIQSRGEPGFPVMVEGHFDNLRLGNGQHAQIEYSGPTDSRFNRIESWTNTGQSLKIKKVSYWNGVHCYGNAENHWVLEAGQIECNGCQGEGASKAQALFLSGSCIWHGGRIFSPSGEKLGMQFGSSELGKTAFGTRVDGVVITGCTGGSLKYDASASNSYVEALIEQASGAAVIGTPSGQVYPKVSGGAAVGPQSENSGTVNIAAATSATVEHGLLGSPSQVQLSVQKESTGLTGNVYWIKRTATQIEIRNNTSAEVAVKWWAKV